MAWLFQTQFPQILGPNMVNFGYGGELLFQLLSVKTDGSKDDLQ